MNNIARQVMKQVESLARLQTDTDETNTEQIPKPLVIAGTSEGLLFLDGEQHIELKDHSINALSSSDDGLWAIADRNSVWHRNDNGEWHQVALVDDLQLKCILPFEGAVLVGTHRACLIRIADGNTHRINCFEAVEVGIC